MPEISTFYGITIRMFNKDHQPPHFHAEYGGKMESIDIRTGRVLVGNLPKRAHKMAMEWWEIHRDELLEMWETKQLLFSYFISSVSCISLIIPCKPIFA